MDELGQAAIMRAAWSKRQLFEVMVDFWSNHLNVTNPSDNVWGTRHDYDRAGDPARTRWASSPTC